MSSNPTMKEQAMTDVLLHFNNHIPTLDRDFLIKPIVEYYLGGNPDKLSPQEAGGKISKACKVFCKEAVDNPSEVRECDRLVIKLAYYILEEKEINTGSLH